MTRPQWIGGLRYYAGTGCACFDDDQVIQLTVAEEELWDMLRRPPFVTVPMSLICDAMALSSDSVKQLISGIRGKLGPASIVSHRNKGYRINPRGLTPRAHVVADIIPWRTS